MSLVQLQSPLQPIEREVICAALEDCVDQLAVLGGIMPNYADKPSAVDNVSQCAYLYMCSHAWVVNPLY